MSNLAERGNIMNSKFYKMRRNRMISGVLAGLSDANFGLGVIIYIILASIMPTKEEIEAEMYGTGPRKRKEAQAIDDNEGWFW